MLNGVVHISETTDFMSTRYTNFWYMDTKIVNYNYIVFIPVQFFSLWILKFYYNVYTYLESSPN